ncbi:MAG: DUF1588 domain-containing protein [Myxococcota bacterium]
MRRAVLAVALLSNACTGVVDDRFPEPEATAPQVVAPVDCTAERPVGTRMLRRLSRLEVEATLREVFQAPDLAFDLPYDPVNEVGLQTDESLLVVGPQFAGGLHRVAMELGLHASSSPLIDRGAPCYAMGGEDCARGWLSSFGRRLYRRPLSADETERYLALYRAIEASGEPFPTFVRWATVALVDSPHLVYRSELGLRGDGEPLAGRFQLTPYELATALAYTYTGKPPTDLFLDRVSAGALDDRASVADVARSLAFEPDGQPSAGFRAVLFQFLDQWLRSDAIDSVGKDDPIFTPVLRQALRRETELYLEDVMFMERGSLRDLLTSRRTYLNQTLVDFYGYSAPRSAEFVPVDRPPGTGVGLLAQGSFLAIRGTRAESSPTRRGLFVRRALLCEPIPPAPGGVDIFPETTAATTRGRHAVLLDEPYCRSCHVLMEPIGFGLEAYDALGRYREVDGGEPVNASGTIVGLEAEPSFSNAEELAAVLSELPEARACFEATIGAFGFGIDTERSGCLALVAEDRSVVDQFIGLTETDHFYERVAE